MIENLFLITTPFLGFLIVSIREKSMRKDIVDFFKEHLTLFYQVLFASCASAIVLSGVMILFYDVKSILPYLLFLSLVG